MSPPEMSGQPLSKNILQVFLLGGGKYLKALKLLENKAFKAIMGSVVRQGTTETKEPGTRSVYLKICLVMPFPV